MVQPRGRPAPSEWEVIKQEFEDMYLRQNMTLRAIHQHFAKQGFVATFRQYKTKVKAWELDKKKIKGPVWHSMHVIMLDRKQHGRESIFIVPIRGNDVDVVRSDRIWKQINRDRSPHDFANIQRAYAILQEHGVKILDKEEQAQHYPYHESQSAQWAYPSTSHQSASQMPPLETDSMTGSSTGSQSPSATRSPPETPITSTFSNLSHRITTGEPSRASSTATSSRPETASFSAGSAHHSGTHLPNSLSLPRTAHNAPTDDFEISSAIQSLLLEPSCDVPSPDAAESRTGKAVSRDDSRPLEQARQIAVTWVKPYVYGLYCRYKNRPVNPLWNQKDREASKSAFRTMLKESNRYLFPYCNWILTVLSANSQTVLLTEFLTDCCEIVDQEQTDYSLTYGSPLHFTLALYTENQQVIEEQCQRFTASTNVIRMLWGVDSPNYLVNQYYHAWLLLNRSQHVEAVQILEYCLPIAERCMGRQHAATVNCLAILARALTELNQNERAISTLEDVVNRLEGCPDLLQAYRTRQAQRLAELLIHVGRYEIAETNLRAILADRMSYFGMDSATTWHTIDTLLKLLRSQGRDNEAEDLNRHYIALYNQEVERREKSERAVRIT